MSNKKKKRNNPNKNTRAAENQNTAAVQETEEIKAPAEQQAEEDNIPVQSLSEMLAFAEEAEEKMRKDVQALKEEREEIVSKKTADIKEDEKKTENTSNEQADTSDKPKPIQHRMPDGMPISEAEAKRIASFEDALDRDLEAARRKKLKEEAYYKHQREMEAQKEAERIARAEKAKERQVNAAAAAKKLQEAKAALEATEKKAQEAKQAAVPKTNAVARYFNNTLLSMAAGRAVAVIVIIAIIAYGGAFIYVNSENEKFYSELETKLTGQTRLVTDASIAYDIPEFVPISLDEKRAAGLSESLADTDKDGLSDYYEINTSHTDPKNSDSDSDGLLDGRELRAELDPLNPKTDGTTSDNEVIRDTLLSGKQVVLKVQGLPKTAYSTITKLENNSIQGTPGLVGEAYEFYTDKHFDSCEITFSYANTNDKFTEGALSVFRFNDESLVFEKLTSSINASSKSVSAQITESGIYALCDTSILMQKGKTNIFFLIDNSGSMYPEEQCAGSEENDVEFKRLDFATNLIDMLGVDANYGAGEFSGSYSCIAPISSNYEDVKKKISDIRNRNQIFSGTEIAGAINSAVSEFGDIKAADKNYIILLTDGMPSVYNAAREQQAIASAASNNITVFTIGLGKYIDSKYLYDIAAETNGQFFQASNADALENIYEKIQNFMSYNQVTIEEESGKKGYIIADSGFNVLKDGIAYNNFRASFAPSGADAGLAGLIRDYYTGKLAMSAKGYTTDDGKNVEGYDISTLTTFADGRADLNSLELSVLKAYNDYLARPDKWNYRSLKGGVLHFTEDTRDFIDKSNLKVITADYEFKAPEQTGFLGFLRTITFNRIKDFTSYECVLIDDGSCQGDDLAMMNMLEWYCGLPFAQSKTTTIDFGYDGDSAFEALITELTTGRPAVISYGGSAMNAISIARDANNPDSFVIDAYDCNSPERSTRINLERTPIYDDGGISYQYTASRGSVEESLRIIISN